MRTRSDERGFWERPAVVGRDQENMGAKGRGEEALVGRTVGDGWGGRSGGKDSAPGQEIGGENEQKHELAEQV